MSGATLTSDLSTVEPASALSRGPQPGRWRVSTYAIEGMEGKLLYADSKADAPPVTLPLGLKGWHRVTVGLWGELEARRYGADGNRLKLSGDACFRPLVRETPETSSTGTLAFETIEEAVLTSADLTGQDLVIGPPPSGSGAVTAIAYVRCEPLSAAEVRDIESDRSRTDTRRLISYNDGVSYSGRRKLWDKEDLWEMIEPYRHSDIGNLTWGLVGDVTYFPTKHGTMMTGHWVESLAAHGINPLVTAMEYAHQMGLQFYIYQRMGAWQFPFPGDEVGDFMAEHPELRCLTRDGVPVGRLSYAYPEVRQHQIDLLAEVAAYGVDGVDLNFMRGPVFVFYEEPLVSGFKKEFGEDPRKIDEWDERWLKYRLWPMTEFVRDLRKELDSVGEKLGKRVAISAVTLPTPLGNLYYGLDIETWVREGLVDRLVPWGNVRGMPPVDLGYYKGLTQGTSTTFWPHLFMFPDQSYMAKPGPDYVKQALECYDAGAAGLALWDQVGFDPLNLKGGLLRRLGHIDEMRAAVEAGKKDGEPVLKKLERLGDLDMKVSSAPTTHRERLIPGDYPKHMYMWPG